MIPPAIAVFVVENGRLQRRCFATRAVSTRRASHFSQRLTMHRRHCRRNRCPNPAGTISTQVTIRFGRSSQWQSESQDPPLRTKEIMIVYKEICGRMRLPVISSGVARHGSLRAHLSVAFSRVALRAYASHMPAQPKPLPIG